LIILEDSRLGMKASSKTFALVQSDKKTKMAPMIKTTSFILVMLLVFSSCQKKDVRSDVKEKIDLLGHRNWVLLVDSAYPEQNIAGMETILVEGDMLDNLPWFLDLLDNSPHIAPVIYKDQELRYLDDGMVAGIDAFKKNMDNILGERAVQELPHEEIFKVLDKEGGPFKVLVIKTTQVMPYTSLFFQLDCGYWNADQENALREKISGS